MNLLNIDYILGFLIFSIFKMCSYLFIPTTVILFQVLIISIWTILVNQSYFTLFPLKNIF